MLERCIHLLQLVVAAGGHGDLEQPSSAMSWEEPSVRSFIRSHSCLCLYVAACGYGKNWYKSWMFSTTFPELRVIACQCTHPPGSHQSIVGVKSSSGQYLSRDTAEYPASLCDRMAHILLPLLSIQHRLLELESALKLVPGKTILLTHFPDKMGQVSLLRVTGVHPMLAKTFSQLCANNSFSVLLQTVWTSN